MPRTTYQKDPTRTTFRDIKPGGFFCDPDHGGLFQKVGTDLGYIWEAHQGPSAAETGFTSGYHPGFKVVAVDIRKASLDWEFSQ